MFAIFVVLTAINEISSLSIADKLHSPFSSDCFKRISIGQRLISYDVTRTVNKSTVKGCEEECNIYECTFFSFGISTEGNGTCELSTDREISKRQATDYDLYQRTNECSQGKPTGYEEACYRRLTNGRRLDERFIRHSLPCDTLEACQHQCSIEKHFQCEGFNIRFSRQRPGGGICELSSIPAGYLDPNRDFRFDPEFDYYERDHSNVSPNCGVITNIYNVVPREKDPNRQPPVIIPPVIGGPYYGGDSYGPWSYGYGNADHGPWGSHGYGSGSYISNNPRKPPAPTYPISSATGPYYVPGGQPPPNDFRANDISDHPGFGGQGRAFNPTVYYPDNRRYPTYPPRDSSRQPTYIIIDPSQDGKSLRTDVGPYRPPFPRQPGSFGSQADLIPGPRDNFPSPRVSGGEVCFQRAHVGYRIDPKYVKEFHAVPTILECEAICTKSPYKCTGYSYHYSGLDGNEPNCELTDLSSLSPNQNLLADRSCDFYNRMSVCSSAGPSSNAECFIKTYSNKRISPQKIRKSIFVRGVSDCELECLKSYQFTCRSFTFRYGPGAIDEPVENCFLSDWPVRDLHPATDYVPGPGCEVYERGSYGHGCELDVGPPSIGPGFTDVGYPQINGKYQWNRQDTWRHFTVRGWPCRSGTQCHLNRDIGFWSCEVEGGDAGQWDYCCRPGHQCGFSRGYYYPWCYVGEAGPDQWRPCSEQFYPEFGDRYSYRPDQASNPHPSNLYDLHKGNGPWSYGIEEEFGPPSYWPVIYLYEDPPPNITESWTYDDPHESLYHLQELHDDDPKIQFRPSKNRLTYPKGIVLKIDVKDKEPASDPDHQAHVDNAHLPHIHPRYNHHNDVETLEKVPTDELGFSTYPKIYCKKEDLKIETNHNNTSSKQEPWTAEKSKEVIRDVEKIIEDTAKGSSAENNETLST